MPGAKLVDSKRKYEATVRADGSLICNGHEGSIHKVGALVQDAAACNGWTYWHLDREGEMTLIDDFRTQIRATMNKLSA